MAGTFGMSRTVTTTPSSGPDPADDGGPAPAPGSAIRLDGVSVVFEKPGGGINKVLRDIDLDVKDGEFVVLVGRSGCGKTTILNLAAGLVAPARGQVTVLGTDAIGARPRMGFMLARDALMPWRTATGNVQYGLELRRIPKQERRARAQRWLEAVHLGDAARLWPWQLSQGMRQRVALARTWALDPALLLMDEPFAALDAQTRISVQEEFLALWQTEPKRTVLFVTHDLGEAIALADRVILVGDGRIRHEVEIPFERPRDLGSLVTEPLFHEIFADLRAQL